MKNTLKKWLPLLGIFSGTLAFAASGSDSSYDSGSMNRDGNKQQMMTQITPPAQPMVDNGVGFSVFADYILWDARSSNTTYAFSGVGYDADTLDPVTGLTEGTSYTPGFSFNSGFKVGANAELGFDNWDLEAQYIWLRPGDKPTDTGAEKTFENANLSGFWANAPTDGKLSRASGKWKLDYNVIQLNLGRNYMISQNLSFRNYFGVRGAWLNQTNDTDYIYRNSNEETSNTKVYQTQNWWGVGFQTGLDAAWMFDENWSIFANFGTSLLWGRTQGLTQVSDTTEGVAKNTYWENRNQTTYGIQPTFDLEMGFRWMMTFDDNAYAFLVQAGWEQQIWINHTKFNTNYTVGDAGDLSAQGFTLRARFYF